MMSKKLEIVVASGKGGTGKTTFSSFLLSFLPVKGINVIGVDADVEAPDLVIALGGAKLKQSEEIYDSMIAVIREDACTLCKKCYDVCQFGAVEWNGKPRIIRELCEGCGSCKYVCPSKAIEMAKIKTGEIKVYGTEYCEVVTGELEIGRKHSGKLVDILKNRARDKIGDGIIIVDAAAGTGCPVISSIAGSDYLIIVVEPTIYSIRTATKIVRIAESFGVDRACVINKFDMNKPFIRDIEEWAKKNNIFLLGVVPYDENVVRAYVSMQNILSFAPNSVATKHMKEITEKLLEVLGVRT